MKKSSNLDTNNNYGYRDTIMRDHKVSTKIIRYIYFRFFQHCIFF